jgi:hypothetical protein
VNIYTFLEKLAQSLPSETDRKAALEVIKGLEHINGFGSAAVSVVSETDETAHVHIKSTEWNPHHPGFVHDVCSVCKTVLKPDYELPPNYGNYSRNWRGY